MSLRSTRRRKRLSMTSLIDVIFLLLLFFMLSSTFSHFAEVELTLGGAGAVGGESPDRMLFLRLTEDGASLNGRPVALDDLAETLSADKVDASLLVSVTSEAPAQSLADVIVAVHGLDHLSLSVLENK